MRVRWILSGRSITPLGFPKRNNVGDEARRGQSTEIAIIIFLNQLILIHEPLLKNAEMRRISETY